MKYCPQCKTLKNENEFGRDKHTKSGLRCWCKTCSTAKTRAYEKTTAGQKSKAKYHSSEKYRQRTREQGRRFRRGEKYRVIKRRYNQSEKGKKQANLTYERAKESGKLKARKHLNDAIYAGKFPPAKNFPCFFSGPECSIKMDYHHFKGYSPEHYFDVVPLCRRHHKMVDDGKLPLNLD